MITSDHVPLGCSGLCCLLPSLLPLCASPPPWVLMGEEWFYGSCQFCNPGLPHSWRVPRLIHHLWMARHFSRTRWREAILSALRLLCREREIWGVPWQVFLENEEQKQAECGKTGAQRLELSWSLRMPWFPNPVLSVLSLFCHSDFGQGFSRV